MASLKERLEAAAKGDVLQEDGGRKVPVYDMEEMKCVTKALGSFMRLSKAPEDQFDRIDPPALALPLIL